MKSSAQLSNFYISDYVETSQCQCRKLKIYEASLDERSLVKQVCTSAVTSTFTKPSVPFSCFNSSGRFKDMKDIKRYDSTESLYTKRWVSEVL